MMNMMVGDDGDGVTDFCDGGDVTENDASVVTMAIPEMEDNDQHS